MPNYQNKYLSLLSAWLLLLCASSVTANESQGISLKNNSLDITFDLSTGNVDHWRLPGVKNADDQLQDMAAPTGQLFALQGQLAGKPLQEWEQLAQGWTLEQQTSQEVVLSLKSPQLPFVLKKTWRLSEHAWRADFDVSLELPAAHRADGDHLELQVGPGVGEKPVSGLGMGQSIYSFTQLVYNTAQGVSTVRLGGEDEPSQFSSSSLTDWDWVGLESRYLAMILVPTKASQKPLQWTAKLPEQAESKQMPVSFLTSIFIELPIANSQELSTQTYSWNVFGGGKAYGALTEANPDLGGVLFSGLWDWLRGLSLFIMKVLQFIHAVIGSWGLSIILLAVLVRLALYPIAKNAMMAQKKFAIVQARLQPQLEDIRRRYKGGEQSERILELYESNNVSPLAGMKPLLIILIQVPVFVSLYHLLGQTFELRDASFLWIKTLAEPDQLFSWGVDLPVFGAYFNLLPVLMALTTLLSIKVASASGAKTSFKQTMMSLLMGLGFFVLFYSFPAGMVLYWTSANIFQVLHQKIIKAE